MSSTVGRKGVGSILFLLLSIILGLAILATDHNIWRDSPSHAYYLAGFIVIDLALLAYIIKKPSRQSLLLVSGWGLLQVAIMIADIFNGPSTYGTPSDFATYLFGLGFYDSNHIAFLFPGLFVTRILLTAVAFLDSRKASKPAAAPSAAPAN